MDASIDLAGRIGPAADPAVPDAEAAALIAALPTATARRDALLARLIAFDTTSRYSNLPLIAFVESWLDLYGVRHERIPSADGTKANIFATLGPDGRGGVMLAGHTDVVPVDGQPWTTNPFRLTERGGLMLGRGTCDMKGFIACVLAKLPDWAALPLTDPVHFAFTYDEEVACMGAPDLARHIRGLAARPRLAVVGEPTSMRVVTAHKGVCLCRTRVTGVEAHSSQPHLGANAISAAARITGFLEELEAEYAGIGQPDSGFEPPYTTVTAVMVRGGTAVNIIPRDAELDWSARLMPGHSIDDIVRRLDARVETEVLPRLKAVSDEAGVTTVVDVNVEPLTPEADSPAEAMALALTGSNRTHVVAFATEAGIFQRAGVPVVVCGPGSIDQAHRADEFVAREQLDQCITFLDKLDGWLVDGLDRRLAARIA
ncbi:acetylornithine deacetylase [Tistrella mobilis]|uniref:Acetylornithine deacetylase (ArgE) n=1 Tax=Tistrella mobilis (strain KA081020-065) TaxID=1110502 RepID=I3TQY0_TISMK|nr:acetylornithine deacetylase [Tistrella mobilis]AFK55168.1 acetylornithine deacetylase (ArgE) [Tistrella mobilis KA081020-065]MAM74043.1 acetylornithine deacetylase [Tistrella sp.]